MSDVVKSGAGAAPVARLSDAEVRERLLRVPGWSVTDATLSRTFTFRNYYQTVSFVNAVAWIAHTRDHHPDISFGYKTCTIRYTTHDAGGLSEKDFACAAQIDALLMDGRGG